MPFPADPLAALATTTLAESRTQIERARRLIAGSRRLREQTETALATSRRVMHEASRVLGR